MQMMEMNSFGINWMGSLEDFRFFDQSAGSII